MIPGSVGVGAGFQAGPRERSQPGAPRAILRSTGDKGVFAQDDDRGGSGLQGRVSTVW